MSAAVLAACGTPAGYHRHRRAGEAACEQCKAGLAGYQAQYRADTAAHQAYRRRTEQAALRALAKAHRDEYLSLLAQERRSAS